MKFLVDIDGIGAVFSGNVTVADEAYGVSWNASTQVPTKNAVYDAIEALTFLDQGVNIISGTLQFKDSGSNQGFFMDSTTNETYIEGGSVGNEVRFSLDDNSAQLIYSANTITFPVATGTVALTSDIPAGAGNNIYNSDGSLTGLRTVTMGTNELQWSGTGGIIYMNSGRLGVQTPVFGGSRLGDNEFQAKNIDTQSILFKNNAQATVGSLFMNPTFDTFTIKNFNGEDNFIEVTANDIDDTNASRSGNLELGLTLKYTDTGINSIKLFNNDVGTSPGTIGDKMGILLQTDGTFQSEKEFWFGRFNGTVYSPIFTVSTAEVVTFTNDIIVPDEAYSPSWNGSLEAPTKNAVYDKIETLPTVNYGGSGQIPYSSGSTFSYSTGLNWNNSTSTLELQGLLVNDITPTFPNMLVDGDSGDNLVAIDPTTGILKEITQAALNIPDNTDYVDLTTVQTVGGTKTFSGNTTFTNGLNSGSRINLTTSETSAFTTSGASLYNDTNRFAFKDASTISGESLIFDLSSITADRVVTWPDSAGTIALTSDIPVGGTDYVSKTAGGTFDADISVPDEAYGVAWNGSLEVPTKNAIYDKIETLGGATTLAGLTDTTITSPGDHDFLVHDGTDWKNRFIDNLGETEGNQSYDIKDLNTVNVVGQSVFYRNTAAGSTNTPSSSDGYLFHFANGDIAGTGGVPDRGAQIAVTRTGTKQFWFRVMDDKFWNRLVNAQGDTMTGSLTVISSNILLDNGTNYGQISQRRTVSAVNYESYLAINGGNGGAIWGWLNGGGTDTYLELGPSGLRFYDGTTNQTVWHSGNDGSTSGLDAQYLSGKPITASGNRYDVIPFVASDGVMEVGQIIDFHTSDGDTGDFTGGRITGNGSTFSFSLPLSSSALTITGSAGIDVTSNTSTVDINGVFRMFVSSTDNAHQRADARDDATTESRLHWFGVTDSGGTTNFKHAWYDGSHYINVTAENGGITWDSTDTGTSQYVFSGGTSTDVAIGDQTGGPGSLTIGKGDGGSMTMAYEDNYLRWRRGGGGNISGWAWDAFDTRIATLTTGGVFTSRGIILENVSGSTITSNAQQTRDKIRVWNSALYTIGMKSGYTYGGLTNDYAMSFQMNNANSRGFWWGDDQHTDAQGAMALTTDGRLTVAAYMRLGYGEADTTTPGTTYRLQANGQIQASDFVLSSDARLKENIRDYEVKPIPIRWRVFDRIDGAKDQLGVIAQEVLEDAPQFVVEDDEGMLSVRETQLLIAKNAELEARVERLEAILEQLLK